MTIELQKKLDKQKRLTDKLMGNYRLGSKGSTRVTFARNAHWNNMNTTKVYYAHTKLEC